MRGACRCAPASTSPTWSAPLRRPRAVVLMVQAGEATDRQIDALARCSSRATWSSTAATRATRTPSARARAARAAAPVPRHRRLRRRGGRPPRPVDHGRRRPRGLRPGGGHLRGDRRPGRGHALRRHLGADGAGHFVKMIHNGIEYADMQLIAETYALMLDVQGLDYPAMQAAFAEWNRGEPTLPDRDHRRHPRQARPETGQPMVEVILDRAGQKGTGGWASGGARLRSAGAEHRRGGRGALALGAQDRARGVAEPAAGTRGRGRAGARDGRPARRAARRQALRLRPGASRSWRRPRAMPGRSTSAGSRHLARRLHHPGAPHLDRIKQTYDRQPGLAQPVARPVLRRADRPHPGRPARGRGGAARHGVAAPARGIGAGPPCAFDGYRARRARPA